MENEEIYFNINNIQYNSLTNVKQGIVVSDIFGTNVGFNGVSIDPYTTNPGFTAAGIGLYGCDNSKVFNNLIDGNTPVGSLQNWNWHAGVLVDMSPNVEITCNTTENISRGLRFGGLTTTAKIRSNTMRNNRNGLLLNNNCSQIGQQGSQVPDDPSDNYWDPNGTFTESHTIANNSIGGLSNIFYVRDVNGYNPTINFPLILNPGIEEAITPFPFTSNLLSTECRIIIYPSNLMYANEQMIASNELEYPINTDENKWLDKDYLYRRLSSDSAMLASDAAFGYAYDSLSLTPIGDLSNIHRAITNSTQNKNIDSLLLANSVVAVANIIEYNHQTLNTIVLNYRKAGDLTGDQLTELRDIASQCPYTSGTAVYRARTILRNIDTNIVYSNECELTTLNLNRTAKFKPPFKLSTTNEPKELQCKLYPNPTNSIVNVLLNIEPDQGDVIEIIDMLGNKVFTKNLNTINTEIDLKSISSGVYFYMIRHNKKTLIQDKLIKIGN